MGVDFVRTNARKRRESDSAKHAERIAIVVTAQRSVVDNPSIAGGRLQNFASRERLSSPFRSICVGVAVTLLFSIRVEFV